MSLADWLNSSIGEPNPAPTMPERRPASAQNTPEVAEIHQRLDSIARQIEAISRPTERDQPPVARQLNDAISRLDDRLSRITTPRPQPEPQDFVAATPAVERTAARVYNAAPPPPAAAPAPAVSRPSALDNAIAEILARQGELEAGRASAVAATPAPAPSADISGLKRQLSHITSQLEALQQPAHIEHSIATFRGELAEIRQTITEAMPRQAIESIEREVRQLAQRIDNSRHDSRDDPALTGVEQALGEIQQALRTLKPAEQLAGFDEAIRNLGAKLDTIVRSGEGPGTLRQLEDAIAALRAIVSNVASNEALAQLSEHVQTLSSKVDQLARADSHSDSFAALEARIATLTMSLENRPQRMVSDNSEQLEGAVRALSERLDRMPVGDDGPSAFAHLEQRVSYLLERLEASADHRAGGLGRVEEGLQDIQRHLAQQQASFAALTSARDSGPAASNGLADTLKRELSDIRHSQSESNRNTQDSLEAVHSTLGHVVDRLAMIEGDLRAARAAPPIAAAPVATPKAAMPMRPELPNPAQKQKPPFAPPSVEPAMVEPAFTAPNALREILAPHARAEAPAVSPPMAETRIEKPRPAVNPDLPPDHPIEPGTWPSGRALSPSERIVASENAISELGPTPTAPEQASATNFIAAARRAAQAAAAAPAGDKPSRAATLNESIRAAAKDSKISSKIRSLLVGVSVVAIVLGSFKMALTLLDGGSTPAPQPVAQSPMPAANPISIAPSTIPAPSITSPTSPERQSLNAPTKIEDRAEATGNDLATTPPVSATVIETPATPPAAPASDVTGSITTPHNDPALSPTGAGSQLTPVKIPAAEKLPEAIGGPVLRTAALKGNPAAAYEVAVRYAEGKGVTANSAEAAKWYDRAAQGGIVPAMFRIGTLYEKGISVTKDLATARRYYTMAAERGNAKAMHNLAVLEADGGGNGANYRSASIWFRKAAERGVADSQFNLGILYARGIGVEQNLAESFKWFSLAAAQGDIDAARKRDEVAKRLDTPSLAAAKLAVTSFTPEKQPDDAINVISPANGWDAPLAKTAAAKLTRPARATH